MKMFCKIFLLLPAVLFISMGLRWLVDPGGVAPEMGMTLERGLGLSSQIGDLAGFFLTAGVCILLALVTGRRLWYYPPIMLLLLAATGRLIAWAVHEAAFAGSMIAVELGISTLLFAASRWLPERD